MRRHKKATPDTKLPAKAVPLRCKIVVMKNFIKPQLKRKLILIAIISLLLGSALEIYTFGLDAGFFLRWLRAFFVFFTLIGFTVLAVVPGVSYSVNRIYKGR